MKARISILVYSVFSCVTVVSSFSKKEWKSLYPHGKSSVEEISPDEIQHIMDMSGESSTATMIEFYAPWCPHCQHFSPKYEKVGENFVGSTDVRITALDCVHYKEVCKEHNINSYPTVKVFGIPKEPASLTNEGYVLSLKGGKDNPKYMINWLYTQIGSSGGGSINEGGEGSMGELDNIRNEDASLSLHEPLLPSKLVHSGERWSNAYTSASLMPARLRIGDVASSLLFALRYGVFVDGDKLKDDQRLALGTFLSVLSKAFPGPSSDRKLIQQLLLLVDSGELSTDKEWELFLSSWRLQGRLATSELRWSGLCDPSRRKQDEWSKASGRHISGGYTCGLWQMFHMLTMTAPIAGLSANEITGAIRTFVDHFFGCEHCRNHFLGMYDACEMGRCDSDSIDNAQLWLWRLHNAVNVRTAFEALKDEVDAAGGKLDGDLVVDLDPTWALWPTEKDCPRCRIIQKEDKIEEPSSNKIVEWDEKEVLSHLKRAYDIGLWEDSKLTTMVSEAEASKESALSQLGLLFSWEKVMVLVVLIPVVLFWLQQRRKQQKGAHKKSEDYCKMT